MIEFLMVAGAPTPVAPFSHATACDGWLFVTGQMPTDPADDGAPLPDGIEAQTRRVMDNLKLVLAGIDSALDRVVFARVYLTHFERDYAAMNRIYQSYFAPGRLPARTCIGVTGLARGALVENRPRGATQAGLKYGNSAGPEKAMSESYPRDMIGYGAEPPQARWPGEAQIALQFVINYEEGAENAIFHGDSAAESFLSEWIGAQPTLGLRNMNMESLYEYGSRAGFWRLYRAFTSRNLPVTVYGVAMALERNPPAVAAMLAADWEIATHGSRWIDYQYVAEAVEREHIAKAIEVHTRVTGSRPLGWYQGRCSPNTRRLVAEEGGFLYNADSYADDLPYWDTSCGKPQLIVPYAFDSNDMRFATPQGFNSGDQFFSYLKDSFDVLYREGETRPRMMSVGLHCRLAGRPGRTAALERFLDYAMEHERVWITRRIDIARHWIATYPFPG